MEELEGKATWKPRKRSYKVQWRWGGQVVLTAYLLILLASSQRQVGT